MERKESLISSYMRSDLSKHLEWAHMHNTRAVPLCPKERPRMTQHLQHLFTDNTCLSEFNTHTHTYTHTHTHTHTQAHTHTHTPLTCMSASLAVSQLSTLKYIQKGIHF